MFCHGNFSFDTVRVTSIYGSFRAYLSSLFENDLGTEGGMVIAEMLENNKTITSIKYVSPAFFLRPFASTTPCLLPPLKVCISVTVVTNTIIPMLPPFVCSLGANCLGPQVGKALAEALDRQQRDDHHH